MLVGAFSALAQKNLKRLLAYSSVTHMGTLLVGLLCQTSEGLAATTFYVVVYVVASFGAFAVIASLADKRGEPMSFDDLRGLGYRHPVRCAVLVLLLNLACRLDPRARCSRSLFLCGSRLRPLPECPL